MNFVSTLYSIWLVCWVGYKSARTYFSSPWSYFEIFFIFLNGVISMTLLNDGMISITNLRVVESWLSIIIIMKLIYFMQLVE